jgi:hypothetical protein
MKVVLREWYLHLGMGVGLKKRTGVLHWRKLVLALLLTKQVDLLRGCSPLLLRLHLLLCLLLPSRLIPAPPSLTPLLQVGRVQVSPHLGATLRIRAEVEVRGVKR